MIWDIYISRKLDPVASIKDGSDESILGLFRLGPDAEVKKTEHCISEEFRAGYKEFNVYYPNADRLGTLGYTIYACERGESP